MEYQEFTILFIEICICGEYFYYVFGDIAKYTMKSLGRLSFDLRVREKDAVIAEYRVPFREVVQTRFDVQSALIKAFQEAWERENGYDET